MPREPGTSEKIPAPAHLPELRHHSLAMAAGTDSDARGSYLVTARDDLFNTNASIVATLVGTNNARRADRALCVLVVAG